MRLPRSRKKLMALVHHTLDNSQDRGKKYDFLWGNHILCLWVPLHARRQEQTYKENRKLQRCLPHDTFLPRFQGMIEAPSRRLSEIARPFAVGMDRVVGSVCACTLALRKERQITSFTRLCFICFLAPILSPTAMRISLFSKSSPQFEDGIACSQSPECGAEGARILAWSRLDKHIDSRQRFNTSTTNPS